MGACMLHGIIELLHMMLIQLVLSKMMVLCTVHILIVILIMCSAVRALNLQVVWTLHTRFLPVDNIICTAVPTTAVILSSHDYV